MMVVFLSNLFVVLLVILFLLFSSPGIASGDSGAPHSMAACRPTCDFSPAPDGLAPAPTCTPRSTATFPWPLAWAPLLFQRTAPSRRPLRRARPSGSIDRWLQCRRAGTRAHSRRDLYPTKHAIDATHFEARLAALSRRSIRLDAVEGQGCGLGRFARLDVRRGLRRTRAGARARNAPVA